MSEQVVLKDGTVGWVWPLLPTDRAALVREFETLSPESRRRRFLGPVLHLNDAMLKHLVDEVDGIDHVALALVVIGDDHTGVSAGVARMIRYPDNPTAADRDRSRADQARVDQVHDPTGRPVPRRLLLQARRREHRRVRIDDVSLVI